MEHDKGKRGKGKGKPSLAIVPSGNVVAIANGQGKGKEGLTSKQMAFADKVAEGATLAESYRTAYAADNMAPATIHSEACRLMANPAIAARINAKVAEKRARESHDSSRIRLRVIERLKIESEDMTSPPGARLKALELLGKITEVALFTERLQTDAATNRSADEIREELKERIAKMAG